MTLSNCHSLLTSNRLFPSECGNASYGLAGIICKPIRA
jgi:hypothetical protein